MSVLSTQPYKGTRDFYPEDKRIQKWMFSEMRKVLELHGYEEYDASVIEPYELFASKTSEEIINDQYIRTLYMAHDFVIGDRW